MENLAVDVLINEQGEIINLKTPKFGEKIGEKTNRDLMQMPGTVETLLPNFKCID